MALGEGVLAPAARHDVEHSNESGRARSDHGGPVPFDVRSATGGAARGRPPPRRRSSSRHPRPLRRRGRRRASSVPVAEVGFALMDRIGWETIVARARAAVRDLPPGTVLGGFSMGVGVVGSLCGLKGLPRLVSFSSTRPLLCLKALMPARLSRLTSPTATDSPRPINWLPSAPARCAPASKPRFTFIPAPGTSIATRLCLTTTPSPPTAPDNMCTRYSRRHVTCHCEQDLDR